MIVDAHTHIGAYGKHRTVSTEVTALIDLMDALGIDLTFTMHFGWLCNLFRVAYEESEAAYEMTGGRIRYCACYSPHYIEESLTWARKALNRPGCVGIKIHPSLSQVYPDDPSYEPVWRLAAERGVPIVAHSWAISPYNPTQRFSTPDHFEHYLAKYPQVNLVLAHSGGLYAGHLAAADLGRRYHNVYLDISGDVYSFGLLEWLVGQIGAERVLFGSDAPAFCDPRTQMGRVLDADLTIDQKRSILGENACRLFKLEA